MKKVITAKPQKWNILIQGWVNIPHSYAIVNCFLIVHLIKYFSHKVNLFLDEPSYFRTKWNDCKKLVYPSDYNDILTALPRWTGQRIDLVYRMSYPYNLNCEDSLPNVPVCVFFTSEFAHLDVNYFKLDLPVRVIDDDVIQHYIRGNKHIVFTSPSQWSAEGLQRYMPDDKEFSKRHRIVTHGVDTNVFFKKTGGKRQKIREKYGIANDDIAVICIGSMTQNKGILELLVTMRLLTVNANFKSVKLIMKGSGDLYESKQFLELYFGDLQKRGLMTPDQTRGLLKDHIIFTDATLTFDTLNDLYNAADLMISPYVAEGFNLTVLEAIAAGLCVMVSENGSTKQFIDGIIEAVPDSSKYIIKIPTKVETNQDKKRNVINCLDIANLFLKNVSTFQQGTSQDYNTKLQEYIENHLSWKFAAGLLLEYFEDTIG
jgi:glycosyltransferase involved in cell wall biosynthesis